MRIESATVMMAALALAGCDKPGTPDGNAAAGGGAVSAVAGAVAGAHGGWNALDACATLDKSVVAATLGSAVTSAELGSVRSDGGGSPLYSQCVYKLADKRMVVFGTTQDTNGANLEQQLADVRGQIKLVTDTPPEPLPGLGKAALWNPGVHMLYVFLGDQRLFSVLVAKIDFAHAAPTAEQFKADAIAIAKKAGA